METSQVPVDIPTSRRPTLCCSTSVSAGELTLPLKQFQQRLEVGYGGLVWKSEPSFQVAAGTRWLTWVYCVQRVFGTLRLSLSGFSKYHNNIVTLWCPRTILPKKERNKQSTWSIFHGYYLPATCKAVAHRVDKRCGSSSKEPMGSATSSSAASEGAGRRRFVCLLTICQFWSETKKLICAKCNTCHNSCCFSCSSMKFGII